MRRMLPAQQCFETSDISGSQACLWLVVQNKFAARKCATKLCFHFQSSHRPLIHLGQIELVDGRTMLLRLKHRGIGIAKQTIRISAIPGVNTDPEACGNINFLPFKLE